MDDKDKYKKMRETGVISFDDYFDFKVLILQISQKSDVENPEIKKILKILNKLVDIYESKNRL